MKTIHCLLALALIGCGSDDAQSTNVRLDLTALQGADQLTFDITMSHAGPADPTMYLTDVALLDLAPDTPGGGDLTKVLPCHGGTVYKVDVTARLRGAGGGDEIAEASDSRAFRCVAGKQVALDFRLDLVRTGDGGLVTIGVHTDEPIVSSVAAIDATKLTAVSGLLVDQDPDAELYIIGPEKTLTPASIASGKNDDGNYVDVAWNLAPGDFAADALGLALGPDAEDVVRSGGYLVRYSYAVSGGTGTASASVEPTVAGLQCNGAYALVVTNHMYLDQFGSFQCNFRLEYSVDAVDGFGTYTAVDYALRDAQGQDLDMRAIGAFPGAPAGPGVMTFNLILEDEDEPGHVAAAECFFSMPDARAWCLSDGPAGSGYAKLVNLADLLP